jgi:hypothetical protein
MDISHFDSVTQLQKMTTLLSTCHQSVAQLGTAVNYCPSADHLPFYSDWFFCFLQFDGAEIPHARARKLVDTLHVLVPPSPGRAQPITQLTSECNLDFKDHDSLSDLPHEIWNTINHILNAIL